MPNGYFIDSYNEKIVIFGHVKELFYQLLKTVKEIDFSYMQGLNVETSLDNLPNHITHIYLNNKYNKTLNNLPNSLKVISFGNEYNQPIDFLPESLEEIYFQTYSIFSNSFDNLPSSLKILEIPILYKNDINNLPDSLEELRIGVKKKEFENEYKYINEGQDTDLEGYHYPIDTLLNIDTIFQPNLIKRFPHNLRRLVVHNEYLYIDDLKEILGEKLFIGENYFRTSDL